MSLPFKVDYCIVCDVVRREDSGKLILVGVYGGGILLNALPSTVRLSQAVRISPTNVGRADVEFRVMFEGEEIAKAGAVIDIPSLDDAAFVALGPFPVALEKEGELRFEMREKGKRWTLLEQTNVRLRSTASSSAT